MLPPVFVAGNMTRALEKLGTPEGVEEFRRTSSVLYDDWDNFCITLAGTASSSAAWSAPKTRSSWACG